MTQLSDVQQQHGAETAPVNDATGTTSNGDAYALQCQYCDWSSLDVGLRFSRSTKITEQLARLRKAKDSSRDAQEGNDSSTAGGGPKVPDREDSEDTFTNLINFYKSQMSDSTDGQAQQSNPYSNSPYSSPANLARIMSLYGGLPYNALKKSREKPQPMREALNAAEGLSSFLASDPGIDTATINEMQRLGWDGTTSREQRDSAPANCEAQFASQLWPAATPLRTRRGRRCRSCRQFLARPEQKVGSMKYKIRLLAVNHIPRLSLRPLTSLSSSTPSGSIPVNPAFHLHATPLPEPEKLRPHHTKQYVLTLRNPIFEVVRISLATPAVTPGKVASRVTILCPSFTVGPAGEVWDDALAATSLTPAPVAGGRSAAMASLTGSSDSAAGERQPEAGKVWERGRNWTSVVVEIVPGAPGAAQDAESDEDDDVLEVPVFVRAEWDAEVKPGDSGHSRRGTEDSAAVPGTEKIKKELGYWVVLGAGTIDP